MTHRLDVSRAQHLVTVHFQGLLDAAALEDLRASVRTAVESGAAVRVVLREGTDVERSCVAGLRELGAELVADSPYLARWIGGDGGR